jgi:Kef-type K+ transport system membrane component KefB
VPLHAATIAPPKGLAEHDVLILFCAFVVFVGLARLLGEVALRLRQPQVLGEILAGVILGPSVLGLVAPALYSTFAVRGARLVEPLSWLGIIFLLTLTAMDLNLARLRRQSRTALSISVGGIVVAFLAGFAFGELAPICDSFIAMRRA